MELNRQTKTLPSIGKHIRIDDLHRVKDAYNDLAENVILRLFRPKGFKGAHRIILVTGPIPPAYLDDIIKVFQTCWQKYNPDPTDRQVWKQLSFDQIELDLGDESAPKGARFLDTRWVLNDHTNISRWPEYGPRFTQDMWAHHKYVELFWKYRITNKAWESTRQSLVDITSH